MKNSDNAKKQQSGQNFNIALKKKFDQLKESGVIKDLSEDENFPHIGYSYNNQYKADFILKTIDDKFIVVRNSNSFRQDRLKILFWDLYGILSNSTISDAIIATVLLFPDSEQGNKSLINLRKKIKDGSIYSSASHMLLESEFIEFLENYEIDKELTPKERGSIYGKQGNLYEKNLTQILNDGELLERFKKSNLGTSNEFYKVLNCICDDRNIVIDQIKAVSAIDSIPLLNSGGQPKTDISLTIYLRNTHLVANISLKKSTEHQVSCCDYKVETFIKVLGCEGTKLATYLKKFQENPTYKAFSDACDCNESAEDFSSEMEPFSKKLTEWALTGAHDRDNITRNELQVSQYFFVNKNKLSFCVPMKNYINYIFDNFKKTYGVPFTWTYPSKNRGKRIQLKVPLMEIQY